jgi:bifunctional DNA-binding transcriptional regulator/antitoxin component of YhaV-PrlF toxin-antitoxin module
VGKVTSKLQVTVPKALAERYAIAPGDEIEWQAAGDVIRVVPPRRPLPLDLAARRRLFDKATERQRQRERTRTLEPTGERGWTREDLYGRSQV